MKAGPDSNRMPFRPRWWGVALAAAGCAAGVLLGNWQAGRAVEKRAAAAKVQIVAARGELLPEFTLFIDNKVYRGRPGYHVVQPLRIAGANQANMRQVLVNRGWAPAGARRDQLPQIATPAGEIALEGVRLERFARAYEPAGTQHQGRVWQNVSIDEVSRWSGLRLDPYVIEQHSALADGLVRDWPAVGAGAEKNEIYALQWYSLAALSVFLLFILNFSHAKPRS